MSLLTARQAADLARVSPSTINTWRERGLLQPVRRAENVRGKPWLYSPRAVLLAEARARRNDPTRRRQRRLASDLAREQGWSQSGSTPPS